jgi:hypothetical protein
MVFSTNRHTCASTHMGRPLSRSLLSSLYRLLQPAAAPLEPLLVLAGVERLHSQRQCICGERSHCCSWRYARMACWLSRHSSRQLYFFAITRPPTPHPPPPTLCPAMLQS